MTNRSWRAWLAILVGLALFAAACGGGSDNDTSSSAAEPDTAEASAAQPADEPAGETADEPEAAPAAETDGETEAEDSSSAPLEDEEQLTSAGEGSAAELGDPVSGGEITWGLTNDGTGFDTTGAIAPGSIRVITALVDPLVGLTVDGGWAPNIAESLVPNDDYTLWTITMRPGITFHDGEPVDAAAVVANLQAFKASPTTGFVFAPIESIEAVDDLSLEVRMKSSWATFPYQLVAQPGWMVSPSTIGQNDTFVSTGAFMLESWTPADGARVVRNPNFWREGFPYLDAINFKFLVDQTVKRQAFEADDIDGYISPGDEDILDFLEDDEADVWIGTAGANEYLILLNTTKPPFDDIRVRRAMAYATDRQFIIDNFRSGLTDRANGPFSPASQWWVETEYPEFNPAMAAALVEEYEAEVGPIEFDVSIEPNPSVIEVLEVLISFWNDVGIEGSVKEIGQGQSAITTILDDFQAFSWFQFGQDDPDGLYVFFHSSGGILNWSNLLDEDIDRGLDIGRENEDPETRKEGYAIFQQALAEEIPMVWIDHLNGVEAAVTRPQLHGIGSPGLLPDGEASLPMTSGSFFSWTGVWLEQ